MKRLRIEHTTGFSYLGDVAASYNEARMLPGTTDSQFVLTSSLDIEPAATVHSFIDYFGTRVSSFDVLSPHSELRVVARSLVEVRPRPIESTGITWERLAAEARRQVSTVEHLTQTDRTRPAAEVAEIAQAIAGRREDPWQAARDICIAVGDAVEYVPGVTAVHTTAAEAWDARKGVCQDMAHIAVGALRAVGIPARYVSGYLHPSPDAQIDVPVTGESHAWVEWYTGQWQGFDPTNNSEIDDRHVLVGRGRDYNDVPPLRGVYSGSHKSHLNVEVTITREA
ncbi:transglutaminase [Microbacterium mangrovi]|uniref:Transglutaminase n=1 Tax=Microbacterium mangrovi TaxID=1348253 RepID=A0A0B1ZYE0_9MICO|nr:transglutaminase family protein [Microbacterium mangrovi]KHK95746.1 transglutaminase [Microbacterium mangrovi]